VEVICGSSLYLVVEQGSGGHCAGIGNRRLEGQGPAIKLIPAQIAASLSEFIGFPLDKPFERFIPF
jgi:cysteine synthase